METKKVLTPIRLETTPNGYNLVINNEGFMYFNEIDLLAGFMLRVGMGDTRQMDRGSIISALFSAMMGDAYTNAITMMRQRVSVITHQVEDTVERMDQSIVYATTAGDVIEGLKKQIATVKDLISSTTDSQAKVSSDVVAARNEIKEVMKKVEGVMKQLGNANTIIENRKKKAEGQSADAVSTQAAGQSADAAAKPAAARTRGGRRKNDAVVQAELERQAAENPNIK